ncbi:hypothetical protein SAMN05661080_04112 [Modestobacter sp. DSM 44400]|uniref:hypothetical protein n=1 Tax=Modestobacter sp. DSM 44400 TaxID=1550230 RepID=UPI000896A5AF|nr:hypothetical protein [Modestobacter sp. DSM 44400]SDY63545.1 hypothetical protein SAMN05661080_04112 [Modestobacter sp. DSM 44400]
MTVPAAPADGADKAQLLDVAYHHEPYWRPGQSDWIKSLLLFFDGVAVLVPDYMRDRPLFTDPTLAQPLADQGLLHRLSPETLVDQQTAEALTELLDDLLRADAFDGLNRDTAFAEISHSRLGGTADAGLTEVVLEQLRERGLARPTVDGVSAAAHRSAVLGRAARPGRGDRAARRSDPVRRRDRRCPGPAHRDHPGCRRRTRYAHRRVVHASARPFPCSPPAWSRRWPDRSWSTCAWPAICRC